MEGWPAAVDCPHDAHPALEPGAAEYRITWYGQRSLWAEVEDAYPRWISWGQPGRERFGMSVTPDNTPGWTTLDTRSTPSSPAILRPRAAGIRS